MLMKIGDAANQFGISHRALHYWEGAGILRSSRAENDYRYYDEENLQKIRQIVLLRKLRLSIPSIQEIFQSEDLSKVVAVFTAHLDETQKEQGQLDALGKVLRQLLNMLRDRQDVESVYKYLSANHSAESEELKAALQTVLAEPVKEAIEETPEPIVDMTGIDLSLAPMSEQDIPEVTRVIKRCYANVKLEGMDKLLDAWYFTGGLLEPDCQCFYKIMRGGRCVGAVSLAFAGMEAMLIRSLAYMEPDGNVHLFELLKRRHPDVLCWNLYFPNRHSKDDFYFDWEGKKRRFGDDNGFTFYTDARWDRYIKMLKPHDEVYNSSRYRFALLDGSMDGVSFRFFGVDDLDWYDGKMTGWRVTDCDFAGALIYDTYMGDSRFYDTTMAGCEFTRCDFTGATIDGIPIEEALEAYRTLKGEQS